MGDNGRTDIEQTSGNYGSQTGIESWLKWSAEGTVMFIESFEGKSIWIEINAALLPGDLNHRHGVLRFFTFHGLWEEGVHLGREH